MKRSLAFTAIGMIFAAAAGFLVAASNGVSIGSDHDHTSAADHGDTASAITGVGHADHPEMLVLPEDDNAPSVTITVTPDAVSGWNLHIETTNFRFAPENASTSHVQGEGHAHIYINGQKVARHYGAWYHIAKLPGGTNTVEVVLSANDHRVLSMGETPVMANVVVDVT